MAEQWRVFVIEDDETLNQNISNTLRKDGYSVQGVASSTDALRTLWSEDYDVVLFDLKPPVADGFELLQWLRAYRPTVRTIIIGGANAETIRSQALEYGAVSYLERPLDMSRLKEELRGLVQQTGFSASLESFDLLDVIQIITMSRKSIALLISTGLEEYGTLRFQNGDLIWAEYGFLRGEEAFFALAAHKNGTVIHQPWNQRIAPNVTQPLSRLIFQALQYRTKYATMQQLSGKHPTVATSATAAPSTAPLSLQAEHDDRPFQFLHEHSHDARGDTMKNVPGAKTDETAPSADKEWWQQTGKFSGVANGSDGTSGTSGTSGTNGHHTPPPDSAFPQPFSTHGYAASDGNGNGNSGSIVPSTVHKTPAGQRVELPSWLTDQPTSTDLTPVRPSSLTGSAQVPVPPLKSSSAEWQPPRVLRSTQKTTEPIGRKGTGITGRQKAVPAESEQRKAVRPSSPAEWQPSEEHPVLPQSGPLPGPTSVPSGSLPVTETPRQESGPQAPVYTTGSQRSVKRNYNYSALVSALQTLGYSIRGFIAAAVVSIDGQPIAQVAVDDLDISRMCKHFSNILKGVLQSLDQGVWGKYEDIVITSVDRHILMRVVGNENSAFQVLITTRDSDPRESLEVMANVEGAITAALR